MKTLPTSSVTAAMVKHRRRPLKDMSIAQMTRTLNNSTRELEELAIDAEAESVMDAMRPRNELLRRFPDLINPHEMS